MEHLDGIRKKNEESIFHKHNIENHEGRLETSDFIMKVTGVYGGDATKRQIAEAVRIQNTPSPQLLNRKEEWRQFNLPHLEI